MSEPVNSTDPEQRGHEPVPRREPVFNLPSVVLALIGICVAAYLLEYYLLTPAQDDVFVSNFAFTPAGYLGQSTPTIYLFLQPFTYAFLHGGWTHLLINMVSLAAFGSPLANRLGGFRFALFFAATGVAAVALFFALHPSGQMPLVGASGAISGMMGAAARFGFRTYRFGGKVAFGGPVRPVTSVLRSPGVATFIAAWMLINLATGLYGFAFGFDGQIAWEAHLGGFVAGFFGLGWFDRGWQPPAWEHAEGDT
jgi:membrane associated rhomboid family serine protease